MRVLFLSTFILLILVMPANITKDTFANVSFMKLTKSERDYQLTQPYVAAAKAIARLSCQSVYIFDYFKNEFLYLSDHPLFLCGQKADYVKRQGFDFFINNLPMTEVHMLAKVHTAGFRFFNNLSHEEKLHHSVTCNFHLLHKSGQILVSHKITPILLDEIGSIWLAMGNVSMASERSTGNVEIINSRSLTKYRYDFDRDEWKPEKHFFVTTREKEIIMLSAQGLTNKEICLKLNLTEAAIKFHKSKLFKKLGVSNMVEVISFATNHMKL